MLALVDGEPRRLSLKKALTTYLDHRQVVITRRSQYELARAQARAHILEGLLTALDHLDEVIDTIRRSRYVRTARTNLQRKFKLTEAQAQAILDMPLKRLAALERKNIEEEYKEKKKLIKHLEGLLRSPKKIRAAIREELLDLKERYGDPRRTQVADFGKEQLTAADLIPDEPVWIGVSRGGLVGRTPDDGSAPPRVLSRPADAPVALLGASTRDTLYLFTADGRATALPAHQLPEGIAWEDEGTHYADLTPLSRRDTVVAALALPPEIPQEGQEWYLFLTTRQGVVKRVTLEDLPGVSIEAFTVMGVDEEDALGWAAWTQGDDQVVLLSAAGQAIRFAETEVRAMGLPAGGVMGIKLQSEADAVVGMTVVQPRSDLFVVTSDGNAKRTPLSEYSTQGRYGQGVITIRLGDEQTRLAGGCVLQADDPVIMVTERGAAKTIRARNAPRTGRATQGEEIIALRDNDVVVDAFLPRVPIEIETD
jgi:DNA gyrase subunit A